MLLFCEQFVDFWVYWLYFIEEMRQNAEFLLIPWNSVSFAWISDSISQDEDALAILEKLAN